MTASAEFALKQLVFAYKIDIHADVGNSCIECHGINILHRVEDGDSLLLKAVCTAFLPTMKYLHLSQSTANVRYGQLKSSVSI